MTEILLLCTANVCRSPMAAALLRRELAGQPATVRSAGLRDGGVPPPEVVAVMAARGLDVAAHRGRRASPAELAAADLIVTMAREQLRWAVVQDPDIWPRTFTLRELIRRGAAAGPRRPDESLAVWLARAGAGRQPSALLGDDSADDVADPIGGPLAGYEHAAAGLTGLTARLAALAWPR